MFRSKFSGPNCRFDCKSNCRVRFFEGAYRECEKTAEAIADYLECDCRGNEEWITDLYLEEYRIQNNVQQIKNFIKKGHIADSPYHEIISTAGSMTRLAALCLLSEKYGSFSEKNKLYETIKRGFEEDE